MTLKKYRNYVREFQDNNAAGVYFIDNQLAKHLAANVENQTEIEHILDYLYSTKKQFSVGYVTIKEKADKWSKKLQESAPESNEKAGVDFEIVKDWGDGFKFVKLISKAAYQREGKLMSHCAASYFGKNDTIYSLRDKNNNPHCTTSQESQQIKGKGNGSIDPKYVKYVVEFLESLGISVRESEMKNLGYVDVSDIKDDNAVFAPLFRDKYFYKDNDVKDKDGKKYESVSLWSKFGLLIKNKLSFDFRFDIEISIQNFLDSIDKIAKDNSTVAGLDYSTVAGLDCSTVAGRDNSTVAGLDYSTVAGRNNSTVAGRDCSTVAGRSNSTVAGLDYSTVAGLDYSTVAGLDCSTVAGRDNSTVNIDGVNSVGIAGYQSKIRSKKGSAFTLGVYDEKRNLIGALSAFVDGAKIKEDTYYCVKDEKLVEWHDGIFNA